MASETSRKPTRPAKVKQDALAKHLVLDRGARSVRELFDRGVLPSDIDRQNMTVLEQDRCREAYILHLRNSAAGRPEQKDEGPVDVRLDPDIQLALLRGVQIELAEIKKRKTLGELIERSDMLQAVSSAFSRVKTVLLKIPKKHAGRLATMEIEVEVREYLDERIREALDELASTPVESIGKEVQADDIELDDED